MKKMIILLIAALLSLGCAPKRKFGGQMQKRQLWPREWTTDYDKPNRLDSRYGGNQTKKRKQ